MSIPRKVPEDRKAALAYLLRSRPETENFIDQLDELQVLDMDDGGMGSLLLIPRGSEMIGRIFGRQLILASFQDSDEVYVSVAINADKDNRLFELDVWKVDFTPLVRWPDPSELKLVEVKTTST